MAATTTYYLYPASNGTATSASGSYTDIDDAWNAPDEWTTTARLDAANDGATSHNAFACFGLTAPPTGLTINWIRVHIRLANAVYGAADPVTEPVINVGVRLAGGAIYYNSSSRTIVDAGGVATASGTYAITTLPHNNRNIGGWRRGTGWAQAYWQFTSKPDGTGVWTASDLQTLLLAVWADSGKGSPGTGTILPPFSGYTQPGTYFTSLYVEVNATLASVDIEEKRLMQSALLKLVRSGTETLQIGLPPAAADVDLGGLVAVSHATAPDASGAGWGRRVGDSHVGILLGKTIDLGAKRIIVDLLDGFRFHCGLWFPAITDLPYTEEGQGIPYLDAGGGRTFTRYSVNAGGAAFTTKGYVRRQTADTLYAEVPLSKEKWSPDGLAIFRESYAALPNNSFSQGAGTAFTGWTNVVSGGSIAESTSKYLFDVAGLRRSALLTSAAGGWAGFTHATASLGATGFLRVHIIAERFAGNTDVNLHYRLLASDNWYWNDAGNTWQVGYVGNTLTSMAVGAIGDTHSKVIPSHGTGTYTLHVYALTGTDAMYLYYANVWWGATATGGNASSGADMRRPPFVTTAAAAYEGQDILTIANPATARSWDPTQGTGFMRLKTAWAHADMEAGGYTGNPPTKPRMIAMNLLDGNNRDAVFYYKGDANTGYFAFRRRVASADYAALVAVTGADRPSVGSVVRVAWRWQATGGELGLADYTLKLFVSVDGRTPLTATQTAVAWAPASTTINLCGGFSGEWDGWIRGLEIVPYVLPDNEIYRRMGL